ERGRAAGGDRSLRPDPGQRGVRGRGSVRDDRLRSGAADDAAVRRGDDAASLGADRGSGRSASAAARGERGGAAAAVLRRVRGAAAGSAAAAGGGAGAVPSFVRGHEGEGGGRRELGADVGRRRGRADPAGVRLAGRLRGRAPCLPGVMRADRAAGLALGVALDAVFADPRRGHPVALFGRAAAAGAGRLAERVRNPLARTALTAAATWAVLGGTSLAREGALMASALEADDLRAARERLPHLCGRDPSELEAPGLARATVESLAENTSDAVVAPLFWGAVAGVPGLLAYRAINTLDAMVGHRSPRYERFGWAAARLDDVANYVPSRHTGLLTVLAASDRRKA